MANTCPQVKSQMENPKFRSVKTVLLTLISVLIVSSILFAETKNTDDGGIIPLNTLINESAFYDGKTITVKGEAIIEALERGKMAWVNINDGTNAVGVFMPLEAASKITYFGDYNHRGDVMTMVAEMHRACQTHGGDLDLHFVSFVEITKGKNVEHSIDPTMMRAAIFSFLIAMLIMVSYLYRRVRSIRFKRRNSDKTVTK